MSSTLRLTLEATTRDLSAVGSEASASIGDSSATTHDYLDPTPKTVATAGAVGAAFVSWPTSVVQIQRVYGQIPASADLWLRWGGDVASVQSSLTAPSGSLDTLTLVLGVDGVSPVTTTFTSADTTMALVAKRINYAHGAAVASVNTAGKLVLSGTKSGGADAKAASRQYGEILITGGSALSALGLTAATTPATGQDERVGAGPYARSFPSTALPRALEISGSATGLALTLAGKAS